MQTRTTVGPPIRSGIEGAMLRLLAISLLIVLMEMLMLSVWHPQSPHPPPWRIGEIIWS